VSIIPSCHIPRGGLTPRLTLEIKVDNRNLVQDVMLEDGDAGEEQPDGTGRACTPVDEGGLELAELFGGDVAQSLEE
jgi:hypothetical protein